MKLGAAIPDVIDVAYDPDGDDRPDPQMPLPLLDRIRDLSLDEGARRRAVAAARTVLAPLIADFEATTWWYDEWTQDRIERAPAKFDAAFDRWLNLFRAAVIDQYENKRVVDHTRPPVSRAGRARAAGRRRRRRTCC
ncbi:hypothetical protein SALBM217S_05391 [Streptomyces griseoloalbus]